MSQVSVEDLLNTLIQNKLFLIRSEHIKPSFDDGTFGTVYKEAMLYFPRGEIVSTLSPPQDGSVTVEAFIRDCEKIMKMYREYWFRHPCIVDVYGVTCINNQPCLVMERIDIPLSCLLQSSQRLKGEDLLHIAIDIVNGLRYLHALQIVHCALCIENVVIVGWNAEATVSAIKRAKVTNLSRACKEHSQWLPPSRCHISLLPYIPEEYCNSSIHTTMLCNKGIDMYSYGVVLNQFDDRTLHSECMREIASKVVPYGVGTMTAENAYSLLCQQIQENSSHITSFDSSLDIQSNRMDLNRLTQQKNSVVNPVVDKPATDSTRHESFTNISLNDSSITTEVAVPVDREEQKPNLWKKLRTAVVKVLRTPDGGSEHTKQFMDDVM